MPVSPLVRTASRTTTRSSQPQRRGRPVVEPNSLPRLRSSSPSLPRDSVGNGPLPTLVVYAFEIPTTACTCFGETPRPVAAPPADALDDVTNGYVPWSTSRSVP